MSIQPNTRGDGRPPHDRHAWWRQPIFAGFALALLSALILCGGNLATAFASLTIDGFNWVAGGMFGSLIVAVVLGLRSGIGKMIWSGAPLAMTFWVVSRVALLLLIYLSATRWNAPWLLFGLVPLLVISLSATVCDEWPSPLIFGAAVIGLFAVIGFYAPLIWIYDIAFLPTAIWPDLQPVLASTSAWGAAFALSIYLLLGRRLAQSRTVAPLLFWDAIATGIVLLVMMELEGWRMTLFNPVAFFAAAALLGAVRALWFRGLTLSVLPYIALVELAFLSAGAADGLIYPDGSVAWSQVPQIAILVLLFVLPAAVLVHGIRQWQRGARYTFQEFD